MPVAHSISPNTLARLIALPGSPHIVDLRHAPSEAIPGSRFLPADDPARWPRDNGVVVVDERGDGAAASWAAVRRSDGVAAEALDGGFAGGLAAGLPAVTLSPVPPRHDDGRTWWVTRSRPKVDRIACPWLIRRFVDPDARFLFVAPAEVLTVATLRRAEPFDVADDRVFWTRRGERCTFDLMVETFGLGAHAPLLRLATIVRGADTARPDLAPEAAGLLAISLGLSRMYADDHAQLDAGIAVYDALYRWCRDAQSEKHDGSSHQPPRIAPRDAVRP